VHTLRGGAPARPIAVPVLYLHGASDGCIGCAAGDGQEIHFTGPYERAIIERAGHFLQLEAPDMVASFIVDWFWKLSGRAWTTASSTAGSTAGSTAARRSVCPSWQAKRLVARLAARVGSDSQSLPTASRT
jgi:hypothetical protein